MDGSYVSLADEDVRRRIRALTESLTPEQRIELTFMAAKAESEFLVELEEATWASWASAPPEAV